MSEAPFFIVGSGRSGTTLLRLMLASHPRIEIPPETWFLLSLVRDLPLDAPLSSAQVEQAIALITGDYRWPDMEMDADAFAAAARAVDRPRLAGIADLIYAEFRRRSGKPRCGDKTPPYAEIIPQIAALYPTALFIHLLRDGRDVATSFIDAGFPGAFWDPGFEWRRAVAAVRTAAAGPLGPRILEVRYEDLVRTPEPELRRICAFLNEAFDPAMLEFRTNIDAKVPARERAAHRALDRPISPDAIARWRGRLTGAEQFALESCLGPDLEAAGYELRFGAPAWRPALRCTGFALRHAGPFIRRAARALHHRGLLQRQVYLMRNYERTGAR